MIKFNLKKLMKDKKVTLKELSSKTGLSINTLSLLSTGRSKGIQFDTLERIVNILECKIEDLIILDDGYNTLEILDVELIPKDNFFIPLKEDNNMYLKCTYLNEDRDTKKLLLTFNENTPFKGVMVNLAGDFPTEILTTEKYSKGTLNNEERLSQIKLFIPFMSLIFKKAYENKLYNFDKFPVQVNFMPYDESLAGTSLWQARNLENEKIRNQNELKDYINIEGYKLFISYKVYEHEILDY